MPPTETQAPPDRPMPTGGGPDCNCPACAAAKRNGLIVTPRREEAMS